MPNLRTLTRWCCRLLSCEFDGEWACSRCGEWVYGDSFIQNGYISERLFRLGCVYQRFRDWTGEWKKCEVCRKWFWTHKSSCCSEKCYEDWFPF